MRVLVTWGSKRGGTEEIARIVGEELAHAGLEVDLVPAEHAPDPGRYAAVVVGGALYANRWHRAAARFVARHIPQLRRIPVWLFSSGPLDDSAKYEALPPPRQVAALVDRIGAVGHVTFGGRLTPDARGFPASMMARKLSGDWRDPARIRGWAQEVARTLPTARPRPALVVPGRAAWRVVTHGAVGWLLCGLVMFGMLRVASLAAALAVHAIAAPLIFIGIAIHYFRPRGARAPLPTALAMTAVVIVLDLGIVAGLVNRSLAMFGSVAGTWLPFALIFLATWLTGLVVDALPATPRQPGGHPAREASVGA